MFVGKLISLIHLKHSTKLYTNKNIVNREFSEFIMHNFNEGISTARFPDIFKNAEVKPVLKEILELIKVITGLLSSSLQSPKFSKD